MGKIKSAIITSLLVAAILVLAFFSLVSMQVPGSGGVDRYNSFISSINLGADVTGEAHAVLYPDGVISAEDYNFSLPEDADKLEEYKNKYVEKGNVYIEKDVLDEYGEEGLKTKVANDAKVISKRFGEKGYSSYSVSVIDGYALKVTVPTNFTYAEYKRYDTSSRSDKSTLVSQAVRMLTYDGELTLRNSEVGKTGYDNILTPITADITTYFKSFVKYSAGTNHAVKVNLTKEGRELFKSISKLVNTAENDKAIGFYIGENQLLSLTVSEEIDSSSFYISVNAEYAEDYAITLNSVAHGSKVELSYNSSEAQIVYANAPLGDLSAIMLGVSLLVIILACAVYSVVRYRLLGLINVLMISIYSLALIVALMLIGIQLTVAGALCAVLGLALMCGSNFALFEEVRKQTKLGKTMQSSVKAGYRKLLAGITELHIVLFAVSLLLTLVGVGELASCGFIMLIATVASYVLYWFTRFMWYVISSPVKNKFKFCGFAREDLNDD